MRKTLLLLPLLASCASHPPPVAEIRSPPLASWHPSLHLADTALAGGAPGIALQVADELLAANPRNAAAMVRRGEALAALGRPHEAEAAYRAALAIAPGDIDTMLALGRLRLTSDPADAERIFAQAASADPHNAAALNDLGIARDLQGHHAAAQDAYRQALAAQPTSASAQVNLGLSLALSGEAAKAVRTLRPLAAEPDATPRIRHDLALALTLDGHAAEAATVLAQDLPPDQIDQTVAGFRALQP